MTNAGRPSKNERRDAAREKAREQRMRQQRRERRNRVGLQVGIGVLVLAIVAVVAVVITQSVRPDVAGPKNMANGGITIAGAQLAGTTTGALAAGATPTAEPTLSGGTVRIQVFEDFACPYCKEFEDTNDTYLEGLVTSGAAEVQLFPVAILDRSFPDKYSTRAANAAAAVANYSPAAYWRFHTILYGEQPSEESGVGLTDDQLIAAAKKAKATNLTAITKAIRDQTWASWVGDRTDEFTAKKGALQDVTIPTSSRGSTPTVVVNGQYYTGDPSDKAAFGAFVTSVGGAYTPSPTESATPTPTPTETKK